MEKTLQEPEGPEGPEEPTSPNPHDDDDEVLMDKIKVEKPTNGREVI